MAFQRKTLAAMMLLAPMLWGCHNSSDGDEQPATAPANNTNSSNSGNGNGNGNGNNASAGTPPTSGDLAPSDTPDIRDDSVSTAAGLDLYNSGNLIFALDRSSNTKKVVDQLYTTGNASINAGYVENF